MPYLIEILLFLLPFGAYALWRRLNPQAEPDPRLVLLGLVGVGLAMVGAVWYGLSVSMAPHAVYVPAQMGEDGIIRPHRVEPPPPHGTPR